MFYVLVLLCFLLWWSTGESGPPVLVGRLPILGHALLAWCNSVQMYTAIKWASHEAQKLGGIMRVYFGPVLVYVVTDPEDAITISSKCLHKHFIYKVGKPLLKNGLVTANVQTWQKHRKLLSPAFTPQVLMTLLDIFNKQARKLVEEFSKKKGKAFDHEAVVRRNNLETICASAFGADKQEFGDLQSQYLPNLSKVLKIFSLRMRKLWLMNRYTYKISSLKKKQDRSIKILSKLADSIIQKKINDMKNDEITGIDSEHLNPFLRTILKASKEGHLTDEEIRGEIDTIIVGGHDTTASSLTFILTLLGSHPDVQEKAYQEIMQVIGDKENIEKEDLSKLTYLEAVIKETIRLYPVVPIIARQTDCNIKLRVYTLKANQGVFISLYGILRDKMWGEDRHEFRPDRWLEKDTLPDPKYYAAFGLGRRFCIGRTYGMISMKVALAHLLRQYKISSDVTKMVIQFTVMIRPTAGHHISLEKRN